MSFRNSLVALVIAGAYLAVLGNARAEPPTPVFAVRATDTRPRFVEYRLLASDDEKPELSICWNDGAGGLRPLWTAGQRVVYGFEISCHAENPVPESARECAQSACRYLRLTNAVLDRPALVCGADVDENPDATVQLSEETVVLDFVEVDRPARTITLHGRAPGPEAASRVERIGSDFGFRALARILATAVGSRPQCGFENSGAGSRDHGVTKAGNRARLARDRRPKVDAAFAVPQSGDRG